MNQIKRNARKPSQAHPTEAQMVAFCVAAFADYLHADATLQNAKALWDAARMGLRTELARAYEVIAHGKVWDAFLAQVRAALVKAHVVDTPKEAGRIIRNQLIALAITGNGKHGVRKTKAGRKEKTATGTGAVLSEKEVAARLTAALAYIADAQQRHAGDSEMLEELGAIASILGGKAK